VQLRGKFNLKISKDEFLTQLVSATPNGRINIKESLNFDTIRYGAAILSLTSPTQRRI
jgi:hypothetical protein